jgi:membrane protein DedA with SNARE-associated domain
VFDRFLEWLAALADPWIYLVLGMSALGENLFPPIPGDTITAFGAFLVGARSVAFLGVWAATTAGSVAGFMALFWIARRVGRAAFQARGNRFFDPQRLLRVEERLQRWGAPLILLNRYFPGVRSLIAVVAGLSRLSSLKVCLLALLSAATWNLLWIAVGYTLGQNWEIVREKLGGILGRYQTAALALLAGFLLALFFRRLWKRPRP